MWQPCWEGSLRENVKVTQSCLIFLRPHGLYSPRNSPGQNTRVGSALQVDSLPAEPQRKPRNTGVGSLCLLQQIFPTQESNGGNCRQILKEQLNLRAIEPVLWNASLKMGLRKNVYINSVDLKKCTTCAAPQIVPRNFSNR